jgi:hypothetical protein
MESRRLTERMGYSADNNKFHNFACRRVIHIESSHQRYARKEDAGLRRQGLTEDPTSPTDYVSITENQQAMNTYGGGGISPRILNLSTWSVLLPSGKGPLNLN